MNLLTTFPNGQLGDLLYQVPITLKSERLEFLVHKVEILLPEDVARILLNYKLYLQSGHFELLMNRIQQARVGVTVSVV